MISNVNKRNYVSITDNKSQCKPLTDMVDDMIHKIVDIRSHGKFPMINDQHVFISAIGKTYSMIRKYHAEIYALNGIHLDDDLYPTCLSFAHSPYDDILEGKLVNRNIDYTMSIISKDIDRLVDAIISSCGKIIINADNIVSERIFERYIMYYKEHTLSPFQLELSDRLETNKNGNLEKYIIEVAKLIYY